MANREAPSATRYAGLGFEFAAAVGGFALVGYWIDRHYGSEPWGLLIGAILGLVGGMYNLIKGALGMRQPVVGGAKAKSPAAEEATAEESPAEPGDR